MHIGIGIEVGKHFYITISTKSMHKTQTVHTDKHAYTLFWSDLLNFSLHIDTRACSTTQ